MDCWLLTVSYESKDRTGELSAPASTSIFLVSGKVSKGEKKAVCIAICNNHFGDYLWILIETAYVADVCAFSHTHKHTYTNTHCLTVITCNNAKQWFIVECINL